MMLLRMLYWLVMLVYIALVIWVFPIPFLCAFLGEVALIGLFARNIVLAASRR